ncbi:protein pleiotropic regulatory locus 1-like [Solanum pennellii]|uniref:Protein pleiotropic regulatory locus 1-like n=1 Tax=Solanum pennellii TaxID=28526 RepID=A0ABM1UVK7_SOLPN|nr:protein pleiotropic regulatory locus 1-like [Solanum pennellii]
MTLPSHPQVVCNEGGLFKFSTFQIPLLPSIPHQFLLHIQQWDIRYGKTMERLTHHKKSIRAMAQYPKGYYSCFASASTDGNIKKINLPNGQLLHNMIPQQMTIINAMAVNDEGVMATGGDNGSLWFWDWTSGYNFQQARTKVQPGSSMDTDAGSSIIYALTYDVTGATLITCEGDKTIKMWKQR